MSCRDPGSTAVCVLTSHDELATSRAVRCVTEIGSRACGLNSPLVRRTCSNSGTPLARALQRSISVLERLPPVPDCGRRRPSLPGLLASAGRQTVVASPLELGTAKSRGDGVCTPAGLPPLDTIGLGGAGCSSSGRRSSSSGVLRVESTHTQSVNGCGATPGVPAPFQTPSRRRGGSVWLPGSLVDQERELFDPATPLSARRPCPRRRGSSLSYERQSLSPIPKAPSHPPLKLPVRRRRADGQRSPTGIDPSEFLAPLPPLAFEKPSQPNKTRQTHLQPIDDQTSVPKGVFRDMMKAGDGRRGAKGAGQHRLCFAHQDGRPVLRHRPPSSG
mmetsp:Transcript_55376/g.147850  ORF Transcript_55376/g.147850 Transcript_55376/m.147850 type:complete len:331 (-) Transcript_55376:447-1439(-)